MNIIEATKSGKPFRRKDWGMWWHNKGTPSFQLEDVVADDWEIQEPAVTITRTQFLEMAQELFGFKINGDNCFGLWTYKGSDEKMLSKLQQFAIRLGL